MSICETCKYKKTCAVRRNHNSNKDALEIKSCTNYKKSLFIKKLK